MKTSYRKFYLISLGLIVLACAYPIYMGTVTIISYLQDGAISVQDYQKYIIPYTPIAYSLIISAALMPLLLKLCKKYALLALVLLSTVLFLGFEIAFEQIQIAGLEAHTISSWQLGLCVQTPQALEAIGEPIFAQRNIAFKIHFYIIAFLIIQVVLYIVYGFSKMIRTQNFDKKRPLIAALASGMLFVALCIYACFTAFYRTGTIDISPISAFLMSVFFIVFGINAGVYFGCLFYRKRRLLSIVVPAIVSAATTIVMYVGELILMDGELFVYGKGFLFRRIGSIPFAGIDIIIIVLSGLATYIILYLLNRKPKLL